MADSEQVRTTAAPVEDGPNWRLRIALALAVVVLLVVTYVVGTTLVPRWWAHRVGDRVDGRISTGTFYGLFTGFVFTFVPLVVFRQIFRSIPGKVRIAVAVLAVLVAAPNLMTLSIVLGTGNGAHAGDRVLDIEGPGFRAGSAWGAAIGAVAAVVLFALIWKWHRDRRKLKELQEEVQTHRTATTSTSADSGSEPVD